MFRRVLLLAGLWAGVSAPAAFAESAAVLSRVLYLGDSLSSNSPGEGPGMAEALAAALATNPYRLKIAAYCGFSPVQFTEATGQATSPCGTFTKGEDEAGSMQSVPLAPLRDLMIFSDGAPADVVAIQLGTNLYGYLLDGEARPAEIMRQVRDLVGAVRALSPSARIVWLAPPELLLFGLWSPPRVVEVGEARKDEMLAAIQLGAAPVARVIDSRPFTDARELGPDGTHYRVLQKRWLAEIQGEIERAASL
jgi:hypothetical protein